MGHNVKIGGGKRLPGEGEPRLRGLVDGETVMYDREHDCSRSNAGDRVTSSELRRRPGTGGRPTLLDVAAEVLVGNPAASLASVASAAGIGRTTLHKQYATRQELVVAVAHRALDRSIDAASTVVADAAGDDVMRKLVTALVPVGAQLAFLFREPSLDNEPAIDKRLGDLDKPIETAIRAAQQAGALRTDRPEWWFVSTLYALVYVAWEGIKVGRLAPLDATELVVGTLIDGLGATT
jgi:AcrR family transcriptional regulator